MKGLGWPQGLAPDGAGGLGWPPSDEDDVRVGTLTLGSVTAEGAGDVQISTAEAPAQSSAPSCSVFDSAACDGRHVVGRVPAALPVAPARPVPEVHLVRMPSVGLDASGAVLVGWGGAAPAVTDAGIRWPEETLSVSRPLAPSSADTGRDDAAAVVSRETALAVDLVPSQGRHDELVPEAESPTEDAADASLVDPSAIDDVSRETADTRDLGDIDTRDASDIDPGKRLAEGSAVQTAPVQAEWQDQDGSVRMHRGSITPGVTEPTLGYDEQHRLALANSLPRVDESTPLAVEVAEDARRRISLVGRPFPHPPHTRVLTVANQKGGVGKTTTTVNVAAAMAQSGLNVLVLDIDPQGNASTALGIDHHSEIPSLYDVVVDQRPLAQVLQVCPDIPTLLCAPATIDLAGAEIELVSLVARELRLQKALRDYLDDRHANGLPQIDYVFVDCPPSLSLLTVNAFVAAQEVFIPIQCEYYALEGLSQLLKHVELIRGHLNPTLHVSTILLTMYDGRTRLSSQVADEVRAHFPATVLKTSVPRSVRISEAPSHGQTVMTYDPTSSGALSYLEAARELAEQVLTWNLDRTQQEERA